MSYPGSLTTGVIPEPQDLIETVRSEIRSAKHYQNGRINKFGVVEGVREYPASALPHERQVHHLDAGGRAVFFEKFLRDFSRPLLRCYRYQDASKAVHEAVWIDRYGAIENFHRYQYDPVTGLMLWRAEYDHEGKLFYSIRSAYDAALNLIEEAWYSPDNQLLKKYGYTYDKAGELASELHYNQRGALRGFNSFRYDKKGNLLERTWHDAEGRPMSRFRYEFDSQDRVSRLKLLGPGDRLQVQQDFTHDASHNVIREVWTDASGSVVKDLRY